MSWLVAADVLPLAGYAADVDNAERALAYAEALIAAATDVEWGLADTQSFTKRVALTAKSYVLPLPLDVRTVDSLSPDPASFYGSGYDYALEENHLVLVLTDGDGFESVKPFDARTWMIQGARGYKASETPEDINKAASLLAAYFLGLSDPERSRYKGASLGDFSGTMRLVSLAVPEAAAILSRYREDVAAAM